MSGQTDMVRPSSGLLLSHKTEGGADTGYIVDDP